MDCGKKTCDSDRKTSHKDHKTGFQGNISNTAAQDTNLGKCKECYQQSVNTLRTGKKLKKQNFSKFVRVFCYNACCCTAGCTNTDGGTYTCKSYGNCCSQ